MTIYGQNWGDFKRENNECIVTGAREKLHKIKIVVLSTYFFLLMCCYDAFSSRNTSFWRQNDAFRDEKRFIAPHTLSRKNYNFDFI